MKETPQPTIWALADPHLSFSNPRDWGMFGPLWQNHTERIAENWKSMVSPDDIVLLPGDISWGRNPSKAMPDLLWLAALPGQKVIIRGNHDHWWKDIHKVRDRVLPEGFYALQGDALRIGGVVLCGAMGHIAPNDPYFRKEKLTSYQRELTFLNAALLDAHRLRRADEPVILMLHYPPFTSDGQASGFTDAIRAAPPDICIYGHLHRDYEWLVAANEVRDGVEYRLVASDFLNMSPVRVWPPAMSVSSSSEL